MDIGPLDLLVVQPTPFCNLDCRYCYLPDRQRTDHMSWPTLDAVFRWVFASGLVRTPFTVVWHAGEPLVLRPEFYEEAFATADRHNRDDVPLVHSFQTNATLIDRAWCDFLKAHPVELGVSVDGPAFLHDRHRVTRHGTGTHDRVMNGIRRLRDGDISFHVITVLTRDTLDYPDELYDFYVSEGIECVGFNVEEIEGPHRESSLSGVDIGPRFRRFLARFLDLAAAGPAPLWVRELDSMELAILAAGTDAPVHTHETTPFAIVSVDWQGNLSTFSPELLGLQSDRYGDFVLGNVATDSLAVLAASPRLAAIHRDIAVGVERCWQTCAYFRFCGGGAPVNKLCETGSFAATETLFCRLNRQALLDVVLHRMSRPQAAATSPMPA
jgi:uncharacterized protein